MKNLQNKLELAFYGYNPTEFMPIFVDGELDNKNAFIAYKARRVIHKIIP